jgi:hypothetical protein
VISTCRAQSSSVDIDLRSSDFIFLPKELGSGRPIEAETRASCGICRDGHLPLLYGGTDRTNDGVSEHNCWMMGREARRHNRSYISRRPAINLVGFGSYSIAQPDPKDTAKTPVPEASWGEVRGRIVREHYHCQTGLRTFHAAPTGWGTGE